MTKELFVKVIQIHTHSPQQNEKLFILDSHEIFVSYEVVKQYKEAGIKLPIFPPHTTHRFQPLDVEVFGFLKLIWKPLLITANFLTLEKSILSVIMPNQLK